MLRFSKWMLLPWLSSLKAKVFRLVHQQVLKLAKDPNLLILTYHVTYWDRLGWKDTSGDFAFDQRQWEYAEALERKNVFTLQVRLMVQNIVLQNCLN